MFHYRFIIVEKSEKNIFLPKCAFCKQFFNVMRINFQVAFSFISIWRYNLEYRLGHKGSTFIVKIIKCKSLRIKFFMINSMKVLCVSSLKCHMDLSVWIWADFCAGTYKRSFLVAFLPLEIAYHEVFESYFKMAAAICGLVFILILLCHVAFSSKISENIECLEFHSIMWKKSRSFCRCFATNYDKLK